MIAGIHQPNYIPWLGFFSKMSMVDTFVLLDDVEYSKNSYINRNLIKTPKGAEYLTIPVKYSKNSSSLINQIEIADIKSTQRHLKSLEFNYKKSKYWEEIAPRIKEIYHQNYPRIYDINFALILLIKDLLKLDCKIIKSSDIISCGTKSARLISILKNINADLYVAGKGGANYHEDDDFKNSAIEVKYINYAFPLYNQLWGEFLPNLSVIDALFNLGPSETRNLLNFATID